MTNLAPHQQRVVDEKTELSDRLSKLLNFFHTPIFAGVDAAERARLRSQARFMDGYCAVLEERIAAFGERVGLSPQQEPKYTVNGHAIVNRATGEEIPADEPVFIFRARDKHACSLIGEYQQFCDDPVHAQAVEARFIQFGEWADAHPERMKEPDTSPTA